MTSADDARYMARAIALAKKGLYTTDPNPRVGCVLVRDDAIVGEGWHVRAGEAHAEVHALRQAGEAARGATAYVSLEPCCHHGKTPPCSEALIKAGVARVVTAMTDPNPAVAGEGLARLQQAGIVVKTELLREQAEALNPGFIRRMREGRPLVRLKQAMSLDGRTALASGESRWITGAAARRDVHRLRARSSAILTGIDTVLADDPSLNARLEDNIAVVQPVRVVLDSHLRMPATARMLQLPGRTVVLTGVEDTARIESLSRQGAEVTVVAMDNDHLDLSMVMALLAQMQVNELMVEAGPTLGGALLQAGLVDEMVVYMAPVVLGDAARGLLHLPGLERLADKIQLEIADIRGIGKDWRITIKPLS